MIPLIYKFLSRYTLTGLMHANTSDFVRTPYVSTLSRAARKRRKDRNKRAKLSRQINRSK